MAKRMDTARIQGRVAGLLAEYGIPSAVVGVLHDGEMSDFAVGIRDVSTGEPATSETIYQCGSMSKTWTALAFMQFVDEGKVDLDAPVRTYLPGFKVADPQVSASVTPRHLLYHTSGIEEDYGYPGEDEDVYERMVAGIADAPQVHPLGYTHGYSAALGYALLARVMEVIDGKRWDAIMQDRLFTPLGLTSTSSWYEQMDQERAATGHVLRSLEEGPIVSPLAHLPRAFGPGGNVTSTIREVLTMASIFLNDGKAADGKRMISAASLRAMMESRVAIPDPYMFGPFWALGLIVCNWHGQTVYASDGSTIGQNARLRILPEANLALALLTNGGPRESFYKHVFNAILADLGAVTLPELPQPDPTLRLDLSRYEGVYQRPGTCYEVEAIDGRLWLSLTIDPMHAQFLGKPERLTYELLPISETHFLMPAHGPLEDPQTVAIYDFKAGAAHYLHTNSRVYPKVGAVHSVAP